MRITVSIINYRTADLTIACVRSVLDDAAHLREAEASNAPTVAVVVIDNGSGDGSADKLEDWLAAQTPGDAASVRLVRSAENTGFSGGHNIGMAAAPADVTLVLNSDAVLRPGFLAALARAVRSHPGAGLFAARIEYEDGTQQISCFRAHGPSSELIRAAATGPVTRLLSRREVPLRMPPAPGQIEWASFACIALRGAMVDEIGPMDEGYFLYYEDVEYCSRARRAGWDIAYVADAVAVHYRGGSGPVKSLTAARARLPRYHYASRSRYLYQQHGRAGLLAANLAWHLGRGIAVLRGLAGRPHPPVAGEWRDIWTGFADPLRPSPRPPVTPDPSRARDIDTDRAADVRRA